METDWRLIREIFFSFLKIGPVTFGGGYAMIPLIEREVVLKKGWITVKEVTEVFAIAQSVPGAIAINSAIFVGYRLAGLRGAVAAMLGVLLPTFWIVILLSVLYLHVQDNHYIESAFAGIRAAVVAIITYAAYKVGLTSIYDKTTGLIALVSVIVLYVLQVHPVIMILGGILTGLVALYIKKYFGIMTKLEKESEQIE
ncbi:chromate transporter [Psychrobacillus sp. INOP01]|uniref:chromate transporter n=1 Tax=Psychrobacillus sp. INOP01 TaxID=2829187 RepID=UPI001BACDBE8|nr:chromate transporter [Psychrobacillus sp. INOP01]QUG40706.1 chromate transporter [Psychrobacillus sp. INOP01]